MIDCKLAETPIIVNHRLQIIEEDTSADKGQYQRIVGKFIYLSNTRLEIAFVVGVLSIFMHLPQINHMESTMRVRRYLKRNSGKGILFKKNHLELLAYTDADWASYRDGRKLTSRCFTFVRGNLVT